MRLLMFQENVIGNMLTQNRNGGPKSERTQFKECQELEKACVPTDKQTSHPNMFVRIPNSEALKIEPKHHDPKIYLNIFVNSQCWIRYTIDVDVNGGISFPCI